MTISEVQKGRSLYIEQLMKKFVRNRSYLGLLRFFASYPGGRFSKLAIFHAIDDECNRLEMSRALEEMVKGKILDVTVDNGNDYYMLAKEEVLRRLVLNMAVFERRDWQLILKHK